LTIFTSEDFGEGRARKRAARVGQHDEWREELRAARVTPLSRAASVAHAIAKSSERSRAKLQKGDRGRMRQGDEDTDLLQ
jgi:hypothetical protein